MCYKMFSRTILLFLIWIPPLVISAPLPQEKMPSAKTIDFMKQFGYVKTGPNTDFLYTEEGFKDAVKLMQKYGGLPQTGELDNETLALTTAARCGVPDVIQHSNRTKRYIVGSEAWRKRTLTYFLANWPPELDLETTSAKLKMAFDMWTGITPLKFVHREGMDADMIVAFGRGPHGDGYPFDGPGSILAHAFFPYEHGSYGGDLHFDDDEHWIDGSSAKTDSIEEHEGVDFFTVATHEIGHSLGLAHSGVPGSIMFPYYKGYNRNMRMDYDDIIGIYDMYVLNNKYEDDVNEGITEAYQNQTSTIEIQTVPDELPNRTPDVRTNTFPTSPLPKDEEGYDERTDETMTSTYTDIPLKDYTSVDEVHPVTSTENPENQTPRDGISVNRTKTEKPKRKIPDICEGSIDAMAFIRSEIFAFKGLYVWRMQDIGKLAPGYPVYFHVFFRGFPWSIKKIDALYQRPDYNIVFFTGQQYWVFDGNEFTPDSPKPLTDLGISSDITHLDASLVWAKNGKTYFFSGDLYWRFDESLRKIEAKYPQKIQRWKGVPPNMDAAFTWKDDQTYFFKGDQFWRFNNQNISIDTGFPLPATPYWFHCSPQFSSPTDL